MALRQYTSIRHGQQAGGHVDRLCPMPLRRSAQLRVTAAKTSDGPKIAVVGVTGAVGQEFLKVSWQVTRLCANLTTLPGSQVLKERNFPYSDVKMLASARCASMSYVRCTLHTRLPPRSAGKKVHFDSSEYIIEELSESRHVALNTIIYHSFYHHTYGYTRTALTVWTLPCFLQAAQSARSTDQSLPRPAARYVTQSWHIQPLLLLCLRCVHVCLHDCVVCVRTGGVGHIF